MRPLIFFCPFFPDWEATNEAIEEQVARESYFQWLRDNERRQVNSFKNYFLQNIWHFVTIVLTCENFFFLVLKVS